MNKVVFCDGSPSSRECVEVQARADAVYREFGDSAPPPVRGEMVGGYTRRVLEPLKKHSPDWKNVPLPSGEMAMQVAERQILESARREAREPTNLKPGELVERVTVDQAGRRISRFYGDPGAWMNQFAGEIKRVRKIGEYDV